MQPKKRSKQYRFYLRRYLKYLKIVGGAGLLATAFYLLRYLLFTSGFFNVSAVVIVGAHNFVNVTDFGEVVRNKVYDKSIFVIKSKELEQTLETAFQGAKEIKVFKIYPKTIRVEVLERVPLALVHNDKSENLYMVDESGYVLGLVEEGTTNLPKIKYEGDIKVGFSVDKRMVPVYLEMIEAFNREKVSVSSVSFYPKYARLYVENGVETLVSNEKNHLESTKVVSALLKQLSLEGRKVTKIDLRFDKVIVSYE